MQSVTVWKLICVSAGTSNTGNATVIATTPSKKACEEAEKEFRSKLGGVYPVVMCLEVEVALTHSGEVL